MSDSVRPHRRPLTRLLCPWDSPGKNTGVGCHFLLQCMKVNSEIEVAQSCPALSNLMDCSLPGSSVHGIFQARVLEWGAIAFSNLNPTHQLFGEGTGDPLQCSCLENPMGGGAWWAAVHEVAKSWTRLSDFTFKFHLHALEKAMASHSSTLAWKIPWTEEPGRPQSMGSLGVRHD